MDADTHGGEDNVKTLGEGVYKPRERPQKNPALLTALSWTSNLQNCTNPVVQASESVVLCSVALASPGCK